MSDIAVDVRGVSKRFRLAHGRYNSLKERVIHGGRTPHEDFWALKDVSLSAHEGETVGILGRNGSGKSTLLKCICGVLQPTSGEVVVRGKLAGLLELGAGFQQDLTGRENIYLNGSLLGMSKKEVDRVFDDIVDFSELEEFIDGQVKFYSSGMYVRLGFAVAVNVDPDILVVDEVLAVGDERFQRKCIERVKVFQREGRTILFVTHSPDQVRSICDRAVVLSHGDVVNEGPPGEAVRIFREGLLEEEGTLAIPRVARAAAADHVPKGTPDADHPVRMTYARRLPQVEEVGLPGHGRPPDHRGRATTPPSPPTTSSSPWSCATTTATASCGPTPTSSACASTCRSARGWSTSWSTTSRCSTARSATPSACTARAASCSTGASRPGPSRS